MSNCRLAQASTLTLKQDLDANLTYEEELTTHGKHDPGINRHPGQLSELTWSPVS